MAPACVMNKILCHTLRLSDSLVYGIPHYSLYIVVHYVVTTPFCSAVWISSGKYYTLYSALKVSHNALRKLPTLTQPMVANQAIFTIMHCAADQPMEVSTFRLCDSSDVFNSAGVVSECVFFFLPMS